MDLDIGVAFVGTTRKMIYRRGNDRPIFIEYFESILLKLHIRALPHGSVVNLATSSFTISSK